jgi:hypothetical protein
MKTSCIYNFFHITKIQGNILSNHKSGKSGIQTHGTDKAVHRISSPAHSVTLASFLIRREYTTFSVSLSSRKAIFYTLLL